MTEQGTVLSADDRGVALELAVRMYSADRYTGDTKQIIATAREFFSWLDGSADRAFTLELAVRMFTAGRYSGGPQEVIKVAEVFTGFLAVTTGIILTAEIDGIAVTVNPPSPEEKWPRPWPRPSTTPP